MIELRDVGFSYGVNTVLEGITTTIHEGELVGLIGPSGAGKTTLMKIILGELIPTVGSVRAGQAGRPAAGYVPQLEAGERSFPLTVEEMVLLGGAASSAPKPWFDRQEKRHAAAILDRLGIKALHRMRLNELSGGQFQRALIGRALMSRPQLLLLDEPTSGIDLHTRRRVLDLLEDLRGDGYTIVLTTHDLNWVASHLPRIVCLNKVLVADGTPVEVLSPDVVKRTYGADMKVVVIDGRPVVVDSVTRRGAE